MNLYDAVFNRISTRTFQTKQLSNEDTLAIKKVLSKHQAMSGPFGHSFELNFSVNKSKDTKGKKIGTYGLLKHVPAYIGGVCEDRMESIIDFGYVFEHIILTLTSKEFGTCWLGGTFKRDQYRTGLEDGQIIPAISPVGYKASNRSIMEKMLRKAAKSDNRLPFDLLFLDPDCNPLSPTMEAKIIDCLQMVRKGPSASNKQPWRMIIDDKEGLYHFYLERTPNYAASLHYDIQALDIGIALAHFEIGLAQHDIQITREKLEIHPHKDNWEYIISLKVRN